MTFAPEKITANELMFASTNYNYKFPSDVDKIRASLPDLIKKIKYTQNKYIWIKATMGIMTTDLKPKILILTIIIFY